MNSFVYTDSYGDISLKVDDDSLIDKFERSIVGEIKLAATNEKMERARDLINLYLELHEAKAERKKVIEKEKENEIKDVIEDYF